MVILVNFKGVGGSFSTPSPNEKGGPGAKSQAGTNREQMATIARACSRYVLSFTIAGAAKGGRSICYMHSPTG